MDKEQLPCTKGVVLSESVHKGTVETLVDDEQTIVNATVMDGKTELMQAVIHSSLDVVEKMMVNCTNIMEIINSKDKDGNTAFHYVCQVIVDIFVQMHDLSYFDAKNKVGMTGFLMACEQSHLDVITLLAKQSKVNVLDTNNVVIQALQDSDQSWRLVLDNICATTTKQVDALRHTIVCIQQFITRIPSQESLRELEATSVKVQTIFDKAKLRAPSPSMQFGKQLAAIHARIDKELD
ncbi:Aste57867_4649 [Aphanomyces stellatus]|uniref:Aste57867_4649 protein n=1 Tax=Aphanomyces stellatus TaxID=120398 RepID=A0A485KGY1_9STRA|nr:hypothetical protein As57867_004636 [Aphanomyces stellatus]VFT81752.1 Aste57867_4649 [Aphanomyces stellatus]